MRKLRMGKSNATFALIIVLSLKASGAYVLLGKTGQELYTALFMASL